MSLIRYVDLLGMRLLRRQDFPHARFTLAFIGYGDEAHVTVVELTHNWDGRDYELGTAFGHLAVGVDDVYTATDALAAQGVTVTRKPGPLQGDLSETISFVEDPDGYCVELILRRSPCRRAGFHQRSGDTGEIRRNGHR